MSLRILLSLWSKKYIVFHSLSSFEGLRVSDEPVGLTHSLGHRARTQLDVEIDIPTRRCESGQPANPTGSQARPIDMLVRKHLVMSITSNRGVSGVAASES